MNYLYHTTFFPFCKENMKGAVKFSSQENPLPEGRKACPRGPENRPSDGQKTVLQTIGKPSPIYTKSNTIKNTNNYISDCFSVILMNCHIVYEKLSLFVIRTGTEAPKGPVPQFGVFTKTVRSFCRGGYYPPGRRNYRIRRNSVRIRNML